MPKILLGNNKKREEIPLFSSLPLLFYYPRALFYCHCRTSIRQSISQWAQCLFPYGFSGRSPRMTKKYNKPKNNSASKHILSHKLCRSIAGFMAPYKTCATRRAGHPRVLSFIVIPGLDPGIHLTIGTVLVSLWILGSQPENDIRRNYSRMTSASKYILSHKLCHSTAGLMALTNRSLPTFGRGSRGTI